jgi:hypothetical protein
MRTIMRCPLQGKPSGMPEIIHRAASHPQNRFIGKQASNSFYIMEFHHNASRINASIAGSRSRTRLRPSGLQRQ